MKNWFTIVFIALTLTTCTLSDNTYYSTGQNVNFNKYKTYQWIPKDSSTISNVLYDNSFLTNSIIENTNKILSSKGFILNTDSADLLLEYRFFVEKKEEIYNNPSITAIPDGTPKTYIQPFNPYTPTSAYNGVGPYPGAYPGVYSPYDAPQSLYYYNNPGSVYTPGFYANNYPYYSPYGFPYGGANTLTNNVQKFEFKEGTLIIDVIERKSMQLIWRGWNTENLFEPDAYKNQVPLVLNEIFKNLPSRYEQAPAPSPAAPIVVPEPATTSNK